MRAQTDVPAQFIVIAEPVEEEGGSVCAPLAEADGFFPIAPGFEFEMSFAISLAEASLVFGKDGVLMLHEKNGKSRKLTLAKGDGYTAELKHFVDCIRRGCVSDIVPPESARQTVRLIEYELQSAKTGTRVPVRF